MVSLANDGEEVDCGRLLISRIRWEKVMDSKVLVLGTTEGEIVFGEIEGEELIDCLKNLKR